MVKRCPGDKSRPGGIHVEEAMFNKVKFAELRRVNGLAMEDVARAVGRDKSTVSKWENGHIEPNPRSTRAIAKFFKVRIYELFV